MKLRFTFLLLFLMAIKSYGMGAVLLNDTTKMAIGKSASGIVFSNLINSPEKTSTIDNYKGKIVILDFWGTYCQPCVAMLPKMVTLQKQFEGKFQVLLVNDEPITRVSTFFSRMEKISPVDLPCELNAGKLFKQFGIQYVPQYVWINKEGKVCAVTAHDALTEKNIAAFIKDDAISLTQVTADAPISQYDYHLPLLSGINGDVSILKYHSIITGHLPGQSTFFGLPPLDGPYKGRKIMACNYPVKSLYQVAFSSDEYPYGFPMTRIISRLRDSSILDLRNWKDTLRQYCYELILPKERSKELYTTMRQDLARYFGITGKIIQLKTNCWVLIDRTKALKASTNLVDTFEMSNYWVKMSNQPMSKLMDALQHYAPHDIILDETHIDHNIDLDIETKLNDMQALKKAFGKYGLDLVQEQRPQDYLILSDAAQNTGE